MARFEIKLDKNTLPADGQRVKWQTQDDFDKDVWKEGRYSMEEDCDDYGQFCVGFEDTHSKWDCAFKVLHWEHLE